MGNFPFDVYADYSGRLNPDDYTIGRDGNPVLLLVCHNTEGKAERNTGQDAATAQNLSDFEARFLADNGNQVSIHYIVGEEAAGAPIYTQVPDEDTAYHCGGTPPNFISSWTNPDDGRTYTGYGLNQVAIGIELVGQHYEQIGPNQAASLKKIVTYLTQKYPVLKKPGHIVAHKSLEGDRLDGTNWVELARGWAGSSSSSDDGHITPTGGPGPGHLSNVDPKTVNPLKGVDGSGIWVVGPIRDFLNNNTWLGLPCGPEQNATDAGLGYVGSFQYFERARVEKHTSPTGATVIMLGRIGAELLDAQKQLKSGSGSGTGPGAVPGTKVEVGTGNG